MARKDDKERRRNVGGKRARLSSWHFGSINSTDIERLNDVKEVNSVGARFAVSHEQRDLDFLLRAFNNYLMKYVTLLSTGRTSPEGRKTNRRIHRDTRRFLALFHKAGSKASDGELMQVAARLPNAFISMDADDIYNELSVIFCDLAHKFNGTGGFTGFIQHRFAWAVKQRMFQIQRDPMNYQPLYNDDPTDEHHENTEHPYELEETETGFNVRHSSEFTASEDGYVVAVDQFCTLPKLTPAFISCAPEPFNVLWTRIQRAIMVGKFVREMSDSAISEWLGLGGAANVRKEFNQAIEMFRQYNMQGDLEE